MENRIICTEIYEAALSMIGERNAVHNADYAERAPYLLAAFCCEAAQIDRLYRKTKGYGKQPEFGSVMIELASPFPLSPRFWDRLLCILRQCWCSTRTRNCPTGFTANTATL